MGMFDWLFGKKDDVAAKDREMQDFMRQAAERIAQDVAARHNTEEASPAQHAQRAMDRPVGAAPLEPHREFTEAELMALDSIEVRLPPEGARCSDNDCPCPHPGNPVEPGTGYIYVDPSAVEFRADARTNSALSEKGSRVQRTFADQGIDYLADPITYKAILMCETGARARKVNLHVAAADARLAWSEGRVPLRATPSADQNETAHGQAKITGVAVIAESNWAMDNDMQQTAVANDLLANADRIFAQQNILYAGQLLQFTDSSPPAITQMREVEQAERDRVCEELAQGARWEAYSAPFSGLSQSTVVVFLDE